MSKHIFDVCSYKASIILKRFCQLINESDADIHIVMAQKAICLHELLVRNGELSKKEVYTNVAVEFGQIDFAGKRIAIIDDIIVSGAAISKIAFKLISLGVKLENIRIIALARDDQYQTIDFSGDDGVSLLKYASSLNDADCISLSYEISQMIAYFGMPYDADYPILKKIRISNASIQKKLLFSSPLWETFDVSNDYHREGNITVLTLLPTVLMESRLWGSLGIDLAEWTHLKFRIYLANALDGSAVMQVVPMALMNEIRPEDVSKLYDLYIKKVFQENHIGENWELRTRFRFVQYFLAFKLLKIFTIELGIQNSLELDWDAFTIQTGIKNTQVIEEVFLANYSVTKKSDYYDLSEFSSCIDSIRSQNPELCDYCVGAQSSSIDEVLLDFFVERHTTDEMTAREKLKHPIKHFIRDAGAIDEIALNLRKGFSLHDLMYLVSSYPEPYNLEQVVTVFIDRAIDSGIVVPIIYVNTDGGFISRAYRHGEDLPFGKADVDRLLFFLDSLNSALKNQEIESVFATVTFEKILVFFYQVGLRNKVFNRFLGFDKYPLLREQFCVHGAIRSISNAVSIPLYVDRIKDGGVGQWLREWLLSNHVITEDNDKGGFIKRFRINEDAVIKLISDNDLNNIDSSIKNTIRETAGVIAAWYSLYKTSKDEFKADITAITSCSDSYAFASSLIAEIRYFKRYWDKQYKEAIDFYNLTGVAKEKCFEYDITEHALYSGREKDNWYQNDQATNVINKIQHLFEKRSSAYEYVWNRIWEFRTETTTTISEDLLAEGRCYLYIYSLWYHWLNKGRLLCDTIDGENFLELDQTAKELWQAFVFNATKTKKINPNDVFSIRAIEAKREIPARIEMFSRAAESMLSASEEYVSRIEQEIKEKNGQYSVKYVSCVIIDLLCPVKTNCDQLIMDAWGSVKEDQEKTKLNIVSFGKKDQFYRYGLFYCGEIKNTSLDNPLFELYRKVLANGVHRSYLTRALYFPHLPQCISFKHDLKMHIQKYTEDFSKQFLDKLTFSFVKKDVHQILIAQKIGEETDEEQVKSAFPCAETEFRGAVYKEGISEYIGRLFRLCQPFPEDSSSNLKKSTVAIVSGERIIATGLLIVYKGKTYCVTCSHVNPSNEKLYARIRNTSRYIELKELYSTEQIRSDQLLSDIAIYEPQWELDTPVNIYHLIGEADCITDSYEEIEISNYDCIGYPNGAQFGEHVSLKLKEELERGYYVLSIASAQDVAAGSSGVLGEKLKGFSGAPIYDSKTKKILGIHSYHNNGIIAGTVNTRCVSIQEIIKYLEDL